MCTGLYAECMRAVSHEGKWEVMCHWARHLLWNRSTLVQLNGQKYRFIFAAGSSPGVHYMCAAFLPSGPAQLKKTDSHYRTWSEGKVEFIKLGGCSERCWSRTAVLRPSMVSRSSAWMPRLAVRPLRHRADNTAPDGSVLWPVTQRSQGHGRVNRGQSLRTPHGVPLSSKGRVAR